MGNKSVISCKHDKTIQKMRERVEYIKKLRNDVESVTFFEKVKLKLKSIWLNL